MAVAQLEVPAKILSAKEILALADKRMQKYAARDALYEVLNLYYYGKGLSEGSQKVLAANSVGRPLLRDLERYKDGAQVYSAQRLAPIVDDYQALIGQMPNSRVEPPDSSEAGETKADLATKYLISTHEISDMVHQQADAGFHLPAFGDACYILEIDSDLRRVVWSVVHPLTAFPEFHRGYKRFQVADLIIRTIAEPEQLRRDYGITVNSESGRDCAVTTYISAYQRTIVVGTPPFEVVKHAEWDLGFCPAQWVYNKVNGAFGQSDIGQSLAQQDFMDFAYNILIDGLVRNVYGNIISIRNPQNTGDTPIVLGPNMPPVLLQDDGAVMVTQVGGNIQPAMEMINQTIGDINAATGTSQVRQEGQMHGSIQTGRAIQSAQGPQGTRIDLKQANLGAAVRSLNAMTIEMQVNAPWGGSTLGKQKFEMFGRFKGKSFGEKITGADLKWENACWTRNTVTWDSMVGMNIQQKEMVATQLILSKLTDDIYARELMGIDDPIGMRERITAMNIALAKEQAEVQSIMQGGAGGAQPGSPGWSMGPSGPTVNIPPGQGGAPGTQPSASSSGQTGAPPSPQPIFRPPALAAQAPAGLPTGVPMGVSRKAIETALLAVADKLKGAVFAIGELATNGQTMTPKLLISDHRDQSLVLQTLKPLAANIKVEAQGQKDIPDGAVRVA